MAHVRSLLPESTTKTSSKSFTEHRHFAIFRSSSFVITTIETGIVILNPTMTTRTLVRRLPKHQDLLWLLKPKWFFDGRECIASDHGTFHIRAQFDAYGRVINLIVINDDITY